MGFDVIGLLTKLLGGFNVDGIEAGAASWLEENAAKYPDLAEQTKALAAWLAQTIQDAKVGLDPETIHNSLLGIAADVVHNRAGVNPKGWITIG